MQPELKRELGPWAAGSIVVGTVIGSGIFLVPRAMIQRVGTPGMVFFVWVFGGLLTLCRRPQLRRALPPPCRRPAANTSICAKPTARSGDFSIAGRRCGSPKAAPLPPSATGFFYYLTNFFPRLDAVFYTLHLPLGPHGGPLEFRYGQLFAMALILLLAWLNYYGVKLGGEVQVAVTVVKVALIAFIIFAGLALGTPHAAAASAPAAPLTAAGFFAALVAALWAYDGWNNVSMVASEIRHPQRNLPRALIGGTIAVIAIYLLANAAYFHVLTAAEVASSTRVAAEMMRRILQAPGAAAVSVAAMISIFAALNGSILSGARVPYAAARDGLFLRLHRPRPSALSHTRRVHSGAQRLGCRPGFVRPLRTALYLRDFRQLDYLWHDHRRGNCSAQETPRSAAPLSHPRLPLGTDFICNGRHCPGTFDSQRFPPRVPHGNCFDFIGASLLFLLEKTLAEIAIKSQK